MLEVNPLLGTVEAHNGSVVLERHLFIFGKLGQALDAVGIAECQQCQTLAGLTLLAGMDAILQASVHQHSHTTIGNNILCL